MDVGYNCTIADKWIPKGVPTGLLDINGIEIKTADTVNLRGCTSTKAIVGKTDRGFELFFGSENGSVGWSMDNEIIKKHKVQVIK